MSLSLRDQLLQAGLITKKQAQDAGRQHQQQKRTGHAKQPSAGDEARIAAEKARAAKLAQDEERNRKEREKAEHKARQAEIKQLVTQHRLPRVEGDDLYNFLDGNRIRRIPVDPATRAGLGEGRLMIVRCEGRYEVVPADIAQRIRERSERAVMVTSTASSQPADQNDPYKDYVVPDDLMW
ncbi:MAG: DUF2058 domain-containing protein [Nevskia sp.]|nr:DUF2058 domain-containing protein [Nevskia sp.]